METKDKLWVALDTNKSRALEIARAIGKAKLDIVRGVKVNRLIDEEVFRKDGEVRLLDTLATECSLPIWVDIKLNDVDRTVAGRIAPYVKSGLVNYITIMAKGGIDMMKAAVDAGGSTVNMIAVTELTSLDEDEINLLSGHPSKASVINLSRLAVHAGVKYLVCSGQELLAVRKRFELAGLNPFIPAVSPRFAQKTGPDQKRTMDIVEVLQRGAEAVIVGSLIVGDDVKDPVGIIEKIAQEIEEAEVVSSK